MLKMTHFSTNYYMVALIIERSLIAIDYMSNIDCKIAVLC